MDNMSKLSNYLKERENVDSIESEYGFATYFISGDECYIKDIYIEKQFRELNLASKLADQITEIAKERKCKYLTGTVCPLAKNSTVSLKVLIGYGMELVSSKENLIIFKKDI